MVSIETYRNYKLFFMQFQRIRLRLATDLLRGETTGLEAKDWSNWLSKPPPANGDGDVVFIKHAAANGAWRANIDPFQVSACFTCSECSNACPIGGDRKVFDPQWIFRMANLGQIEPLLTSPAIWLCLQCGRCSDTCGQLVQGRQIIEFLQQKAVTDGYVPADFPFRWSHAQGWIYSEFVRHVDSLLTAHH
jgi:Fe-S oxidoreductase